MPIHDPKRCQDMANAIRILSIDAIEKANSGHPGAPMGMAEIAEVLWHRHLKHNPNNPKWYNRDRFILSNGHGSMLLYSLLYLTGYDLPQAELERFRQLHSKTPGHPEIDITPGVETTTGPLGQGLANAVGMALAEKLLAANFNKNHQGKEFNIVDHFTYVFIGDGCLMEGISHEVCSLAGTLRLSKLIVFYDDNGISIDGNVKGWFDEDVAARFRAYGWHVIDKVDGHDAKAIDYALQTAKNQAILPHGAPTLICCQTIIGKGSPNKAGTHDVHGAALGSEEIRATRQALAWSDETPFAIPEHIKQDWNAQNQGDKAESLWNTLFSEYTKYFPDEAAEFKRRMDGDLKSDFNDFLKNTIDKLLPATIATRKASQNALDLLATQIPELFGGSADLTASNLTNFKGCVKLAKDVSGNHLSYGVREFGMAAMMNGMALHGGFIPYGGTFLTFSDYARNAIRMSALMKIRVIYVMTHDSIGLGEDGPTHQSIEHIPSLRIVPNLDVWRPCDNIETFVAWAESLKRTNGPSLLALSRQNLPPITNNTRYPDIMRGAYTLIDCENPQVILLATGSEVALAASAQKELRENGIIARLVSMPCSNVFDRQEKSYREKILPRGVPCVAIEAAQPDFWYKYVGLDGEILGISTFGESAPATALYEHFCLTKEAIIAAVKRVLT